MPQISLEILRSAIEKVIECYPLIIQIEEKKDIERTIFHVWTMLQGRDPSTVSIMDIGGGTGLMSPVCAAIGCRRVVLVDDFGDDGQSEVLLAAHRQYGVEIVARDMVAQGLQGIEGCFEAITTFDSMEHWHHSPKALFKEVMEKLQTGGIFLLGVPNAVNLRKRVTVPLGFGTWSAMKDWYESPVFRGHVREPEVRDLHYIAADMGLKSTKIMGRNWLGYRNPRPWVRAITPWVDRPLQGWPSLCADIYLLGRKPSERGTN